jgi:hypothetical protein
MDIVPFSAPPHPITLTDNIVTTPDIAITETPTENDPLSRFHTQVPWPANIISTIRQIINQECDEPTSPGFVFQLTLEAAHRNFCLIQRHDGNLGKAIDSQRSSPIGYGSEFRPTKTLEPLLHLHPYWKQFESLLTHGSNWPLSDIDEEGRQKDITEALAFGNHKRATENPDLLTSLIMEDVTHGFMLPLPLDKITRLQGALLAPMNIATQDTIDEHGNIIPKDRLTHDQSYIFSGTNTSVNS